MTGYPARAAPLVENPVHTDADRLVVTPDQNRTQRQTDTHTRRQEEFGRNRRVPDATGRWVEENTTEEG
ncbi:MAG: hypothetical protein U1F76_29075 [Candidatus Competibacteraceae bacterium]